MIVMCDPCAGLPWSCALWQQTSNAQSGEFFPVVAMISALLWSQAKFLLICSTHMHLSNI